jgi:HlyD family secretion protein
MEKQSEKQGRSEKSNSGALVRDRPRFWPILAVVLLAVASLGGVALLRPSSDHGALRTVRLDRGSIRSSILATGTVRPLVTTDISTQISGQVAEVLVDFNDPVQQGQLLARLDPQTFAARVREADAALAVARAELASREAAILRAEAQLLQRQGRREVVGAELASAAARHQEALRTYERAQGLANRGGVSDSELLKAETEYRAAEAALQAADGQLRIADAEIDGASAELAGARAQADNARASIRQREAALEEASVDLERTLVRAPADGILIRRDVEAGQTVAASLQAPTLFTLAGDLSRMRIETHVDEADIGRVRVDQPAEFTVDAYPGRRFEGRVTSIRKAPHLLHDVVTYTVLVDAGNPDLALFPGMTAIVRIIVEELADAVRIPNAALRFLPPAPLDAQMAAGFALGEGEVLVWRLGSDGGPEPVAIRTGASDDRYTALESGTLTAGDEVIVGHTDGSPPRAAGERP